MRRIFTLMAATVSVAACAPTAERINEAQGDRLLLAYRMQPAAMTQVSETVYIAMKGGWDEKGAPAKLLKPGLKIAYFDLDADAFEKARRIAAPKIYGGDKIKDTSVTHGFVLHLLDTCLVYQVRVGELAREHNGTPLFIVTQRIHDNVRAHEVRHCNGEEHDANSVWLD